jgi:hypothetical protein
MKKDKSEDSRTPKEVIEDHISAVYPESKYTIIKYLSGRIMNYLRSLELEELDHL